ARHRVAAIIPQAKSCYRKQSISLECSNGVKHKITESSSMAGVPMFRGGLICSYCSDISDVVTSRNGSNLLASTSQGEIIVALHSRCEAQWAEKNSCRTLAPLRKIRDSAAPVHQHHWSAKPIRINESRKRRQLTVDDRRSRSA